MIKITKLGSSSIANTQQFRRVRHIIENDPTRHFVVVSASGREHKKDSEVTDPLYLIEAHLKYNVDHLSLFHLIEERFISIKNGLGLSYPIEENLTKLGGQPSRTMSTGYLVSQGEYLTARLMAEYLGFPFVDAKDIITFRYDGKVDFDATKYRMDNIIRKLDHFVIPGSYGALPNGTVHTVSHGGSDITGSILADILNADMYENWADVSGILMADPRIVHHPKRINTITYSELRELSYMEVSVLHEEAIFPVKEEGIPINILNTNHPEEGGTIIMKKDGHPSEQVITDIAGKRNFTVIAIYKGHMSDEVDIVRHALEICENYRISIKHIPSGIDPFSVVVNSEGVKDIIYGMVGDMKKACNTGEIKVVDNISLIATVDRQVVYRPGIGGRLLAVLGKNGINIRMVAQGTGKMNIIVDVRNKDYEKTVETIYNNLVVQIHRMLHNSRIQNVWIEYEGRVR